MSQESEIPTPTPHDIGTALSFFGSCDLYLRELDGLTHDQLRIILQGVVKHAQPAAYALRKLKTAIAHERSGNRGPAG